VDVRAATRLLAAVKGLLDLDIDISLLEPAIEEPEELDDQEVDMNYI